MNEMLAGLSVVSTICAIVFGYVAFARNGKKDVPIKKRLLLGSSCRIVRAPIFPVIKEWMRQDFPVNSATVPCI